MAIHRPDVALTKSTLLHFTVLLNFVLRAPDLHKLQRLTWCVQYCYMLTQLAALVQSWAFECRVQYVDLQPDQEPLLEEASLRQWQTCTRVFRELTAAVDSHPDS